MFMKIILTKGLPGSGKSSFIKNELAPLCKERHLPYIVCSADHLFENEAGEYKFDHKRIGAAHEACYLKFFNVITGEHSCPNDSVIVIDNTASQNFEISPYIALATLHGDEHLILEFPCDVETSIKRNIHNVPEGAIRAMSKRWEQPRKNWNHMFYSEKWKDFIDGKK